MLKLFIPLYCLILAVLFHTVSSEAEINTGKFLKTFFPNTHVNILHDSELEQIHESHLYHNFLYIILFQQYSATEQNLQLQTFSLISISAEANVTAVSRDWSPLTEVPIYHQRNLGWGSLNLLLLDGANLFPLFKALNGLANDPMFIHSEDRTLIYQWRNYDSNVLYAPEIKDFKYKAELLIAFNRPAFRYLCLYCNGGNAAAIDLINIAKIEDIFPDSTKNLNGKILKFCSSFGMPTMIDFRKTSEGSWEYFGGFTTPLLNSLKEKMNFSITVHPTKGYGVRLPNGSYNGVLGEIYKENSDFGMAGQTFFGHMGVHYLHIVYGGTVIFSTKWPAVTLKLHAIFQAFGLYAWCLLFGVCFGIILPVFIFIHKVSIKIQNLQSKSNKSILGRGMLFLFCPLLEQNLMKKQVSSQNSERILLAAWLCTVLIITTAYKSKLRDLMITADPEDIPSTFDELAESSAYEIYAKDYGGALYSVLKSINKPVYRNIAKRLELTDTIVDCLGKVLRRSKAVCVNYNVVIEREANLHFTDRMGRQLIRINSPSTGAFSIVSTLITKKKAVFKGEMDFYVSRFYSMGLSEHGYLNDVREAAVMGKAMAE